MPLDTVINLLRVDDAMLELGAADDEWLRVERLVNSASSLIERLTGRSYKQRSVTLRLSGDGTGDLDLGARIVSVSSVQVGGDDLADPVAVTDYVIVADRGQLWRASTWPIAVGNIQVEAVLGEVIPHHIREAALRLVKFWYVHPEAAGGGALRSERIGDYAYERFGPDTAKAGIPDEVLQLLLHERRWSV